MIRYSFIILSLIASFQTVAQEASLYKENDKWGLLNAQQKPLTKAIYDQIIPGIPYSIVKKYNPVTARYTAGCIDQEGAFVIPMVYTDLRVEGLRVIACQKSATGFSYGVLSLKNEILIPIEYKSIKSLGTLRFAVENVDGKIALFTENGKALTDFSIDAIHPFYKEVSIFEQNGLLGLLNREGNLLTEARYRTITIENDGTIYGQLPHEWKWVSFNSQQTIKNILADSVISTASGNLLITTLKGTALFSKELKPLGAFYQHIRRTDNPSFFITEAKKKGVINQYGQVLLPNQFEDIRIDNRFVYALSGNAWKIYSHDGKLMSERTYETIYNEDYFVHVKRKSFWGIIDEQGKEIIPCVYDSILQSSSDYISVKFKGQFGIINQQENWLVSLQPYPLQLVNKDRYLVVDGTLLTLKDFNKQVYYFTNNPIEIQENGLLEKTSIGELWHITFNGLVTKIQQVTSAQISAVEPEHEGYRAIKKDGKWGFVDNQGRLRIPNRYDMVKHFSEGLAPFLLRGKWGFLNKEDDIIIHPTYENVEPFVNGMSKILMKKKYGLINKQNELILPCRFDDINLLPSGHYEIIANGLKGLVDAEGHIIYDPKYEAQLILEKHIIVQGQQKYGVLDKQGFNIIPTMHDLIMLDDEETFIILTKGRREKIK